MVFRDSFIDDFCQGNRDSLGKDVNVGVCGWCGCKFVKVSNGSKYCCSKCRNEARREQSRLKSNKWYHRHKHELSDEARWGLGSGFLGGHRNVDFDKERVIVERELARLKLFRRD